MKNLPIYFIATFFSLGFLLTSCEEEELHIPEPPTSLVATTASNSQIDLTWSDNSDSEGGFKIERKLGLEEFKIIATTGKNESVYSDKSLVENTTYT